MAKGRNDTMPVIRACARSNPYRRDLEEIGPPPGFCNRLQYTRYLDHGTDPGTEPGCRGEHRTPWCSSSVAAATQRPSPEFAVRPAVGRPELCPSEAAPL